MFLQLERHKLFASQTDDNIQLNLKPNQYLSTLVHQENELLTDSKSDNIESINICDIKKLPPPEQCKIILKDGNNFTFHNNILS